MERNGSMITCDRCGEQAFGEIVSKSAPKYPDGWRQAFPVMGRAYVDLCPKCAVEYTDLTSEWLEHGTREFSDRGER